MESENFKGVEDNFQRYKENVAGLTQEFELGLFLYLLNRYCLYWQAEEYEYEKAFLSIYEVLNLYLYRLQRIRGKEDNQLYYIEGIGRKSLQVDDGSPFLYYNYYNSYIINTINKKKGEKIFFATLRTPHDKRTKGDQLCIRDQ